MIRPLKACTHSRSLLAVAPAGSESPLDAIGDSHLWPPVTGIHLPHG